MNVHEWLCSCNLCTGEVYVHPFSESIERDMREGRWQYLGHIDDTVIVTPAPYRWKARLDEQIQKTVNERSKAHHARVRTNTPKEPENVAVNQYDIESVDALVAETLRQRTRERLQAEKLAAVDAYGEDKFAEGTVIKFVKTLPEAGAKPEGAYTYAAVKVGDLWYSTGPCGTKRTWEGLVLWLLSGEHPTTSFEVLDGATTYPGTPAPDAPSVEVAADPKH
jgi:hypothetical protein